MTISRAAASAIRVLIVPPPSTLLRYNCTSEVNFCPRRVAYHVALLAVAVMVQFFWNVVILACSFS